MKNIIKGMGIVAMLATSIAGVTPILVATTLRIGTVLAPTDPMGQGLDKFKAEVEAATKGEVVIEVFHNSQLGDTTEMIDQARAGANVGAVADVARLSSLCHLWLFCQRRFCSIISSKPINLPRQMNILAG